MQGTGYNPEPARFSSSLLCSPLAIAHHGRQQHQLAAFWLSQHLIHHLADGLGGERYGMGGAARLTHPGKQQAQMVINFGDGADGRTRVMGETTSVRWRWPATKPSI